MSVSLSSGVAAVSGINVSRSNEQSAVPVCLAPNGTVAANGVVTLGTALPLTFSGGVWLRLPAGAVSGGAAGLYWAVMSSATVGQVYSNFVDPSASDFVPYIPNGTLTPAVGSNVAYTQVTTEVPMIGSKLQAGALGRNGTLTMFAFRSHPNNANNKTFRAKVGGTTLASVVNTTSTVDARPVLLSNCGSPNINFSNGFTGHSQGGATYAYLRTTIDTSQTQDISITGQLAVATDYLIIDAVRFEVAPS